MFATRPLSRAAPAPFRHLGRRKLSTDQRPPVTSRLRAYRKHFVVGAAAGFTFAAYEVVRGTEVKAEEAGSIGLWARQQGAAPSVIRAAEERSKLSNQHAQVEHSQSHPGVYVWGNNSGRVLDPASDEKTIKAPRRLSYFDGAVLRDLALSKDAGVAVDDRGDLLQWGTGYAADCRAPEYTLRGKDFRKVSLTANKIVALAKDGTVYSLPIEKRYQVDGAKPREASWIPGMSADAKISYRTLKPELGYFEKVTDVATGLDHALLLTSAGRVFTAACSFTYPQRGQLGVRGLSWSTRPADRPYDMCHELPSLAGYKIAEIAAGDYHSVLRDANGQVLVFGDNMSGQLGFEFNYDTNIVPEPVLLPVKELYPGADAKVTGIAAGGLNSYFMVDVEDAARRRTIAEVLACGTGIFGNLGNGRWTHVQGPPTKIKALSGLSEYDERTSTITPIRLKSLSVGSTHAAAVMDNATSTAAADFNYGADVLWWGHNEFYQLGSRRRANSNVPVYIPPLDPVAPELVAQGATGSASRKNMDRASGIIGGVGAGAASARSTDYDQVHRFQLTPEARVAGGRRAEQRVVCGQGNSAVFSAAV